LRIPLRQRKSNLKIGNEVTNFWGGFSAKKQTVKVFIASVNFPRDPSRERFALPMVGFRLRKRQFMTFSKLKMTRAGVAFQQRKRTVKINLTSVMSRKIK